jgi:hypothetical protein
VQRATQMKGVTYSSISAVPWKIGTVSVVVFCRSVCVGRGDHYWMAGGVITEMSRSEIAAKRTMVPGRAKRTVEQGHLEIGGQWQVFLKKYVQGPFRSMAFIRPPPCASRSCMPMVVLEQAVDHEDVRSLARIRRFGTNLVADLHRVVDSGTADVRCAVITRDTDGKGRSGRVDCRASHGGSLPGFHHALCKQLSCQAEQECHRDLHTGLRAHPVQHAVICDRGHTC